MIAEIILVFSPDLQPAPFFTPRKHASEAGINCKTVRWYLRLSRLAPVGCGFFSPPRVENSKAESSYHYPCLPALSLSKSQAAPISAWPPQRAAINAWSSK
jgi:hypothetical protein